MAAIQDVTGDGRPDFAVGGAHPIALPAVATAGAVYFYDGVTGGFLWELSKPAFIEGAFGAMVENVGDVDGDGHDDIAIGSRSAAELGEVVFYSPWTRQTIGTLEGESAGDWFGRTIVALGDLNGDGLGDFGIGAPYADHAGTDSGSYYVYLSPEPATLSLLALGGLALVRRRRAATSAGSAGTPPRARRGPHPSAP